MQNIGQDWNEQIKKKQKDMFLVIEFEQFVSDDFYQVGINYYISQRGNAQNEFKVYSLNVDCYLSTEKIFKHIQDFEDVLEVPIIKKENLNHKLCNYNFLTPIIFRGVISHTPLFGAKNKQKYDSIFFSSFFDSENLAGFNSFFHDKVGICGEFINSLNFNHAHFDDKIELLEVSCANLNFDNCRFYGDFSMIKPKLNKESMVNFSHTIFYKKADFSNTKFLGKTLFHRSTFKNKALFYASTFSDTVNFYFAIFEQAPSFSMCVFENTKLAHFVGVDTSHLIFNVLEQSIHTKAQNEINEGSVFRGRGTTYLQIQHAINLRDSFRVIKETLNAQSNHLESQKWHKLELYAKELELKYRGKIKDLEQDAKGFDQVAQQDKINNKKTAKNQEPYIPRITQNDSAQMLKINKRGRLKNIIDRIQLWFYRHTSDHHTDLLKIISWVIVTIGIFGFFLFTCKYGMDLKIFIDNHSKNAFVALFDTSFIKQNKIIMWFVYALGFFSLFWKWSRIAFFSSITLCMTLISYKYILGVGSFLTSKTSSNPIENLLIVLYTLVMILLLFSLQKTARKNSIVPN